MYSVVGDASPFEIGGDARGVLLVHGFTGSPFEMRYLGGKLADRGFTVACPVLAGHEGRSPVELDGTRWPDWVGSAARALDRLRERCDRVAVVGLSMGALCALHLARERREQLKAVAALAAPLWLPRYAQVGIPIALRMARWWSKLALIPKPAGGSDVRDPEMRRENPTMKAFPVNALASLLEMCAAVRAEVDGVTVPAFLAHGALDHTAPPACLDELRRKIGSRDVKVRVLERSYHVITIDVEREALAAELAEFLSERM